MPDPTHKLGQTIPESVMRTPGATGITKPKFSQIQSGQGEQAYALGIATVMQVDHAKHEVTLRVENGETFALSPVSLTQPGAGARHFLGSMPMPGDVALIGWGSQESGRSKQPYVLGWFPGGVVAGHDWWPVQPFGKDEFDLTPKDRARFDGIASRRRYKLRHLLPGNVLASSAQGADLVLDEGATLTNRRGCELRLRDEDSALVVRSLQQFHAGAGFRVYSGMVQRDATLLPSTMFSDGTHWDAPRQVDAEGAPLSEEELGTSPVPEGRLSPNPVFQRDESGNQTASFPARSEGGVQAPFGANVDPYVFLQNGLFVDASGAKLSEDGGSVSGGKAMYRVSSDGADAASDSSADALAEFRVEVAHTSDGRLPVTEQTDGFDAERLPDTQPRLPSAANQSPNAPFVEMVLGSVVGNDPYSVQGRALYGVPLATRVFPETSVSDATSLPLGDHAATMLRVRPVAGPPNVEPSFTSFTKDGRFLASVSGPGTGPSAEVALTSGARVRLGRDPSGNGLVVESTGRVALRASGADEDGRGMDLVSERGALTLRGAGRSGLSSSDGTPARAGVSIESSTDASVRAAQGLTMSAPLVEVRDASTVSVSSDSLVQVRSGGALSVTTKARDLTVLGKSVETYSGPKDGLASFGPVREVVVSPSPATGFPGGVADQYKLTFGDREETLLAGDHSTTVVVGDATYSALAGTWSARGGSNSFSASPTAVEVRAVVGPATFRAEAGSASVSGLTSAEVSSTGPVTVRGLSVTLVAPGLSVGGIVCGSDLDPVSGLPLATLGMGSPSHLLSSS